MAQSLMPGCDNDPQSQQTCVWWGIQPGGCGWSPSYLSTSAADSTAHGQTSTMEQGCVWSLGSSPAYNKACSRWTYIGRYRHRLWATHILSNFFLIGGAHNELLQRPPALSPPYFAWCPTKALSWLYQWHVQVQVSIQCWQHNGFITSPVKINVLLVCLSKSCSERFSHIFYDVIMMIIQIFVLLYIHFFFCVSVGLDYYAMVIFYTQNRQRLFIWLLYATTASNFHADEANIKSIWLP